MDEASGRIRRLATSLSGAGEFLEIAAVVYAIGGVVGGLILAFQHADNTDGTTHPFVLLGIGIAFVSVLSGVLYWAIARALRLFAEHVALAANVPLAIGDTETPNGVDDEDLGPSEGRYRYNRRWNEWQCRAHGNVVCRLCGPAPSEAPPSESQPSP